LVSCDNAELGLCVGAGWSYTLDCTCLYSTLDFDNDVWMTRLICPLTLSLGTDLFETIFSGASNCESFNWTGCRTLNVRGGEVLDERDSGLSFPGFHLLSNLTALGIATALLIIRVRGSSFGVHKFFNRTTRKWSLGSWHVHSWIKRS
jgi:hypothetical protein